MPADILPIRMRGLRQTWLQRAIGATAWLVLMCVAGACTGPGLETPGDRSGDGVLDDAGLGSGGTGATGGMGGSGGSPDDIPNPPGDGDGDGDSDHGADAGEAAQDASVDDDGGTDPQELEP